MKKYIPNILTIIRIILAPILIILGITEHIWLLIITSILIFLTDYFDGYLANKWNVVSDLGIKADIIADKITAICLLILLIYHNHAFFYIFILEVVITMITLWLFFKKKVSTSLLMGKIKTWFIFIIIILSFINIIFPSINISVKYLVYITFVIQILTIISYLLFYNHVKKNDAFSSYIEFYEIIEPYITNKEFQRRKEFAHHINESVYEHTLRVAYDCYRIARRFNLDYKNLTIAALLHDFYEKPWQNDLEEHPFFQKHAFTHAHNAVVNAKKVFGTKVTPKIAGIMETHMFPVNIRLPKSREAWLLTLVDKADSLDFIMHPISLYHIFKKEKK